MKNQLAVGFLTLFLLGLTCEAQGSFLQDADSLATSPNVLFIAIDDLNDWLGCMKGHPNAKTPNIDRLANQGTLFMNAHCQAPICGPSRASLMTGLRPSTTGIYSQIADKNLRKASKVVAEGVFLPTYFGQHGYKTMGVGKLFHNFAPQGVFEEEGGREPGFGPKPAKRFHYDPQWFGKPGGTQTDWGVYPETDEEMPDYRSVQWVKERLQQKHDRPFFLGLGFLRPHVPWYVPQKWFDLFPLDSIQLPRYLIGDQEDVPEASLRLHEVAMMPTTEWAKETQQWKAIVQAYLACIAFVDHYVGEVLNSLENSPYAENTVVVLWSDHGYHIGEKNRFAKHSLWEEATHVPLIISGPGLPKSQVCTQPVELLDLYPTLLDLCSLPPNLQNEGKSLKPLLLDPKAPWSKPAITTYGWNHHGLRSEHFRFIYLAGEGEELYDHRTDDNEWYNRAGIRSYNQAKEHLRTFLPKLNHPWPEIVDGGANQYLRNLKQKHLSKD